MLAGGGGCVSDIEYLRAEGGLFGPVASAPTLYRTLRGLDPAAVRRLWAAQAAVRERVWALGAAGRDAAAPVFLDIDATLVEVHSEHKQGAAAHYKGGFGFGPMFCFSADGDALGAVLGPGNAAANNIEDHVELLDDAISRLPGEVAAGHRARNDADTAARRVVLRADSAGCSTRIAKACGDRNVGFHLLARSNAAIDAAIAKVPVNDKRWQPATKQNGEPRPGVAVADLTDLVDTTGWPDRTRLIMRREPLHPGAQHSLFPSDHWRYWGHWTDQEGTAAECDATMRAHAIVEDHIKNLKSSGLLRMPFKNFNANAARGRDRLLGAHPRQVVPTTRLHRRPRRSEPQTAPLGALAHPRAPRPQRAPNDHPPTRQPPRRNAPGPHLPQHHPSLLTTHQRERSTPQPPTPTTRRAGPTRPNTNHQPQTPPHQRPNPKPNTPPSPKTPPKDPTNKPAIPQTILMNNQG